MHGAVTGSGRMPRQLLSGMRLHQVNGVYSSKWRPAARAKGGGHSQTRGRAGVTKMSGSTVSAACSARPRAVDDYLLLSKSVPVIPRYGHQMCSIFLWETWLEKQAKTVIKFFIEVCNLTCPFDHIQTSEVCKTPYIQLGTVKLSR